MMMREKYLSCNLPPMALSRDVEKVAGNGDHSECHGAQRGRADAVEVNKMQVQLHRPPESRKGTCRVRA